MGTIHIGGNTSRLYTRMESIFYAIENCLDNMGLIPALILIYASIDFLGSLRNPGSGRANGSCFKSWVKDYLLKAKPLPCNEDELWEARCGIVHTQSFISKNQVTRGTREIVYAIGFWDEYLKRKNDPTKYVGIHVEDLYLGLKDGFKDFFDYIYCPSIDPVIDCNLKMLPDYTDLIPLKYFNKQSNDSQELK